MSWLVNSYLWILFVFTQYFIIAYLSIKGSTTQNNKFLYGVYFLGILPSWTLICKYSNDIVLMGYIYDFVLALSWTLGSIIFQDKQFGIYQYVGIALMFIGIMVFKK